MYTYEAVKAALFSRPTGVPALNRKPTRQCHSQRGKRGLYLHHKQYEYPANLEELDYIHKIEVCEDESLRTYLTSLGEGGRDYTIKTTTYWENMRRNNLEMRYRLKFLYHQLCDQHIINAVGVLKYHPPTFQDFMRNYLLEQTSFGLIAD